MGGAPPPPLGFAPQGCSGGHFLAPCKGAPAGAPRGSKPLGGGGSSPLPIRCARQGGAAEHLLVAPDEVPQVQTNEERTRQRRVGDEFAGGEHRREGNTSGVRRHPTKR